ncbi:MAG: branched-chain amino acid ABC transporter permease [Candidatus Caldarchaeum sp.]|nr:branched-chain amino acid ABC transporter permease [Candidatus Caldarchaeum sp.]
MKNLLRLSGAAGVAAALIAGYILPPYYQSLLIFLFIYGSLALSYDIMGGLLGYMNLGHIIFYGIGAYSFGLSLNYLYTIYEGDVWLAFSTALFTSLVCGAAVALLLSYPLFRVKGFYFAVVTLGLISLLNLIVSSPELSPLTGGFSGITVKSEVARYSSPTLSYYMALLVFAITGAVHIRVRKSSTGLFFNCIKEDEEVAECTGINLFRYKQAALILSAVLASLAGVVYLWSQTYTNPRFVFSIDFAFLPITIALLGGSGTFIGSLIGAAIFTAIYQFLLVNIPTLTKTAIGIVLIGVGLGASTGLVGLVKKFFNHRRSIS